jgi:hypothetical protein
MKLTPVIAALIAVSTNPALAQDAMASHEAMAPKGSMMSHDAMAPKMTPKQMRQMDGCHKMAAAKAAKNKTCAALMKAHHNAMHDSMMSH